MLQETVRKQYFWSVKSCKFLLKFQIRTAVGILEKKKKVQIQNEIYYQGTNALT